MKGIEAIKKFKEKHGPLQKELLDWIRFCNTSMVCIRKKMKEEPITAPQAAEAAGIKSNEAFWIINAMRKYGEVVIVGDDNGYKKYSLKENIK
ncbi:MAG: hypothetical protein WCJ94_05820 [bacterium]